MTVLILVSEALMRTVALDGAGVAMLAEDDVAADLTAGRLVRTLEDWCPLLLVIFSIIPAAGCPPPACAS